MPTTTTTKTLEDKILDKLIEETKDHKRKEEEGYQKLQNGEFDLPEVRDDFTGEIVQHAFSSRSVSHAWVKSFADDYEHQLKGLNFCRGKSLEELEQWLKGVTVRPRRDLSHVHDVEATFNAVATDPSYNDSNFRTGVEKYVEALKKGK